MADFAGIITISPTRAIGNISAQVTLQETHNDELQITEHPVETGASITDHAYKKPSSVVIRCGWSNASLGGVANALSGLAGVLTGDFVSSDYVSGVYQKLLQLQLSRVPFDVSTGKRLYRNMLIQALSVDTDKQTENVLMVTVTCREVILVSTQASILPAREAMATPEVNAPVAAGGVKQLIAATPSFTGSFNP